MLCLLFTPAKPGVHNTEGVPPLAHLLSSGVDVQAPPLELNHGQLYSGLIELEVPPSHTAQLEPAGLETVEQAVECQS